MTIFEVVEHVIGSQEPPFGKLHVAFNRVKTFATKCVRLDFFVLSFSGTRRLE